VGRTTDSLDVGTQVAQYALGAGGGQEDLRCQVCSHGPAQVDSRKSVRADILRIKFERNGDRRIYLFSFVEASGPLTGADVCGKRRGTGALDLAKSFAEILPFSTWKNPPRLGSWAIATLCELTGVWDQQLVIQYWY